MEKDASYGIIFVVAAIILMAFGGISLHCEMSTASRPVVDAGTSD